MHKKGAMITKPLTIEMIERVFNQAEHQKDYLIGLYRVVINFDSVKRMNHFPKVSQKTSEYIFKKAIEFDRENHPDVISGGLWMSMGFGLDQSPDQLINDWCVQIDDDAIEYLSAIRRNDE